jgi:hypothetical protein
MAEKRGCSGTGNCDRTRGAYRLIKVMQDALNQLRMPCAFPRTSRATGSLPRRGDIRSIAKLRRLSKPYFVERCRMEDHSARVISSYVTGIVLWNISLNL